MSGCLSRPAVEHVHVHVGTVVSQNATVAIVTLAAENEEKREIKLIKPIFSWDFFKNVT